MKADQKQKCQACVQAKIGNLVILHKFIMQNRFWILACCFKKLV